MVTINKEICIGCEKCVKDCVSLSLNMDKGKSTYAGPCINCGHCVAICPVHAVSLPEYEMDDVQERAQFTQQLTIDTLLQTIKFRRSIRQYQDQQVEAEKLEKIVQAGRYTATAVNLQACKFIIVQDQLPQLKEMIWQDLIKAVDENQKEAEPLQKQVELYQEKQVDYLFRNAPAVLYIAAENRWDAGLANQNMELAMASQGLGGLYNGYLVFATKLSERAQQFLQLEGKPVAVAMLFGYPAVEYVRTAPRRSADVVWL